MNFLETCGATGLVVLGIGALVMLFWFTLDFLPTLRTDVDRLKRLDRRLEDRFDSIQAAFLVLSKEIQQERERREIG